MLTINIEILIVGHILLILFSGACLASIANFPKRVIKVAAVQTNPINISCRFNRVTFLGLFHNGDLSILFISLSNKFILKIM